MILPDSDYQRQLALLEQKILGEQLVRAISKRIHQCQYIEDILNETVKEIRRFLGVSRVLVYRLKADWTGIVIAESVDQNYNSLLNQVLVDKEFITHYLDRYRQGGLQATADIYSEGLSECHIQWLEQLQVRANLVIPILQESELWGLLAAQNCSGPRPWHLWEIDLLKDISLHLGIALTQHELYRELELANHELQQLAFQDELTQMGNRRQLYNCLDKEWRRLAREKQALSLIICDIDYFKQYNDTYGHLQGDICLTEVAQIISMSVKRPADQVCRYGGEEFVIILPNTNSGGAIHVAGEIRSRIRQQKLIHKGSLISDYVTLSYGVASCIPHLQMHYEFLLKAADKALYQAKTQGRDRIVL
jgi:diguanylate cyclase (GGDEF)-like protein